MRRPGALIAAIATSLTIAGASARADEASVRTIDVNGQTRVYSLDRHDAAGASSPLPIIIVLPGTGARVGEKIPLRYNLPFAAVSGLGPALIVQAQGANRVWDSIPSSIETWRRLSGLDGTPVDDPGFIKTLIAELVQHENGDPHRIYVAGVSAGGYMATRVACEMSDTVTAVATVIATARAS